MSMRIKQTLAFLLCAMILIFSVTGCTDGKSKGDSSNEISETVNQSQGGEESNDGVESGISSLEEQSAGNMVSSTSNSSSKGGEINTSSKAGTSDTSYWSKVKNPEIFDGLKFDVKTIDLKGKTVTIAEWEPLSRKPRNAKDLSQNEKEFYWTVEHIEKLFNCKIEFKNCGAYNVYLENLVKSAASETPYVDFAVGRMGEISQLSNNGFFKSIDNFVDYSHKNFATSKEFSKFLDGKHYGVMVGIPAPYVTVYNPKLIKDSGATDPMEYYKKGQWNMQAFEDIARKCTNLSSSPKKYGIGGHSYTDIGKSFFYAEGLPLVYAKNGKYYSNIFTDKGKKILEYYQKLAFTEKLVHCPFDDKNNPIFSYSQFKNGNVAMMIVPNWEPKTSLYDIGFKNFSVVPMPMGKENKKFVTVTDTCMVRLLPITSKLSEKEFLAVMVAMYGLMGGPGEGVKIADSRLEQRYKASKYENFEKQMLEQNHWRTEQEVKSFYDAWQTAPITVDYFNLDPSTIEPYFNQTFYRVERGDSITSMLNEIKDELESRLDKYKLK